MISTYDFTGQVALVTGASSGMGPATAQAFAEAGAALVLADINDQRLGGVTDELTASGYRALAVSCDVANEDQAAAMVEWAVATFGGTVASGPKVPPAGSKVEPLPRPDACQKHSKQSILASPMAFRDSGGGRRFE